MVGIFGAMFLGYQLIKGIKEELTPSIPVNDATTDMEKYNADVSKVYKHQMTERQLRKNVYDGVYNKVPLLPLAYYTRIREGVEYYIQMHKDDPNFNEEQYRTFNIPIIDEAQRFGDSLKNYTTDACIGYYHKYKDDGIEPDYLNKFLNECEDNRIKMLKLQKGIK